MSLPISVVIAARDEEAVLTDCLLSAKNCTQVIVVVATQSTDKTAEIAQKHGATVLVEPFIDFSQIKNFGLAHATQPWTLILDADERISTELAESLTAISEQTKEVGFMIAFRNHLRDRWLRHGGMYPDYHLRLFRTGSATYSGAVHEKLQIAEGAIGTIQGDIIHLTYPTTKTLFRKVKKYATLESVEYPKKSYLSAFLHAIKRFIGVYFARLGLLDGSNGLINAYALAIYQYILYKPRS